jgi:hypothetical protein
VARGNADVDLPLAARHRAQREHIERPAADKRQGLALDSSVGIGLRDPLVLLFHALHDDGVIG